MDLRLGPAGSAIASGLGSSAFTALPGTGQGLRGAARAPAARLVSV